MPLDLEEMLKNFNQCYKEKCLEKFEEQFKDSFTYGAMETWEDGLAVKDFISQALKEQMKEVMECLESENLPVSPLDWTERDSSIYRMAIYDFKENLKQAGLI